MLRVANSGIMLHCFFFFSHVASCVNVGNLINWYHVTASRFRLISKCTDWAIFQLTLAFNYFWANITVYSIVRLSMCLTLATWNTVIQHWTLSLGVWCWRETAAVWLWSIVESDLRIVMTLQSILSASWKAQRLEISHSTIWDLQKKKQKKKTPVSSPNLMLLHPKCRCCVCVEDAHFATAILFSEGLIHVVLMSESACYVKIVTRW